MTHFSFEQRKQAVALLGKQMRGSTDAELSITGVVPRAAGDGEEGGDQASCARCNGKGKISLKCPNCGGTGGGPLVDDVGTGSPQMGRSLQSVPDSTVHARQELDLAKTRRTRRADAAGDPWSGRSE